MNNDTKMRKGFRMFIAISVFHAIIIGEEYKILKLKSATNQARYLQAPLITASLSKK